MAPTSKPRKSVKKAPARKAASKKAAKSTASKQGPRSSKHGNVTYFSVPKENPECYRRCSPPYRHVDKPTGTKTTLVKYSHRNLTITSPGMSEQVKPRAKKATAKAPAKKTAVKAPARKKAPAKSAQCGCAVTPAKKAPFKAPASWTVPSVGGVFRGPEPAAKKKAPAKKKVPMKIPASWRVPAIGGRFEGKAEPEVTSISAKDLFDELGIPYRPRKAKKKSVETSTAKKAAKKETAVKVTTKTPGAQSLAQDAFETASKRHGFPDVYFIWEKGRPAGNLGWDRGYGALNWKMPLALRKLSFQAAYDLADTVLARMTTGEVRPMRPETVQELRDVCGLKLANYDAKGNFIGTASGPLVPGGKGGSTGRGAKGGSGGSSKVGESDAVAVICYGQKEVWNSRR